MLISMQKFTSSERRAITSGASRLFPEWDTGRSGIPASPENLFFIIQIDMSNKRFREMRSWRSRAEAANWTPFARVNTHVGGGRHERGRTHPLAARRAFNDAAGT